MIERREQNYSHTPVYLTTFYREGVQLKNKFQNLSEAVFKVYKTSSHSAVPDQVKLLKMSRLSNVEAKDSLLVKSEVGNSGLYSDGYHKRYARIPDSQYRE